jgi:hypothetical protein
MKGTGTIEIINTFSSEGEPLRLLRLSKLDHDQPVIVVEIEMPRSRPNPMIGKPRFLKGSLLNVQQGVDELFQKRNHIA